MKNIQASQEAHESPQLSGWAKFGLIVLLTLLSFFAGALVLELALGGWLGHRTLNKVRIVRNIDVERDVTDLVGEPKTIHYVRDEFGLRGDYGDVSQIDVLTLGGSTTDQRAVTDDRTWQELLARRFRDDGRTIRIANAGIDGQSTYGHIVMFDNWVPTVPALKARYILAYIGINDFYREGPAHPDDRCPIATAIQDKSVLFHLYETIRGVMRVTNEYSLLGHHYEDLSGREWTSMPLRDNHDRIVAQRSAEYSARIRTLVERIRAFGATPILVNQRFSVYQVSGDTILGLDQSFNHEGREINGVDAYHMMSVLNATVMDVCHESRAICIDLANEIELEPTDFYDFVHPNDRGTQKLADYLYEKLRTVL